jgi:putative hemolysin
VTLESWLYVLSVVLVASGLPVFAYLAIVYRELSRVTTGRVHEHLEIFEAEIEPRLHMQRRHAARTFRLLMHFWLAFLIVEMTRGVVYFVPGTWEAFLEFLVFLGMSVIGGMHFLPDMLLYRTTGRWLTPLVPLLRVFAWLVWPVRVFLDGAESLARISEQEPGSVAKERADSEAMEALVEAAEEEGILEHDEAALIEQVVEFSDKRVREVMTPRPDIVAVSADATLVELRRRFVETRFSRLPVFEKTLDDIFGVVFAQDLLQVPEQEMSGRRVRELVRHVLLVPETKSGSDLLREMRQKGQPMAVVIDEHGSVAGIVTVEDLVEEIVGELGGGAGGEGRPPRADVVREPDGAYVVRGSVSISSIEELLGVRFGERADEAVTTIAGLLSHVLSRVPSPEDHIDLEGYRFEVLEANQRKVLRVRIRKQAEITSAVTAS